MSISSAWTVREAMVAAGLLEALSSGPGKPEPVAAAGRGDSFVDVLRRFNAEFSYQNLMEVLNFPIWGRSRQEQEEARKALLQLHQVSDEDLRLALDTSPPSGKDLAALLQDRGLVEARALEKSVARHRSAGIPLWRVLVEQDAIAPRQLGLYLAQRQDQRRIQQSETRLLELLEMLGGVPSEKVSALPQQSVRLQKLLEEGVLSREQARELLRPYESLVLAGIEGKGPPLELLFTLPASLIRQARVLPLERHGQTMKVGLVDPRTLERLPEFEQIASCDVEPVLISRADFDREVARLAGASRESPRRSVQDLILLRGASLAAQEGASPAVHLTKHILESALSARATDVHLEPQKTDMRVRLRIDGRLYDVQSVSKELEPEVLARIKILADMDIAEKRRPQDGHFSIAFGGKDYNMRVSTLPAFTGEKLALRILDESTVLRGVRHLGMEQEERIRFAELIHRPYGMILVTGPIGSGKTTTLYSAIGDLNKPDSNIVTIEDPVEYQLQGVNQVQVEPEIGVSFANGLRAILRQDADILMVGEIRDQETARVATWAAMTGQLVLCTLHTNDAISAIAMLCNFEVERFVVAGAVMGVVAQRLVRQLCPDCKDPYSVSSALAEQLGLDPGQALAFHRPKGCNFCFHTGFHGRTGVHELLVLTDRLRERILDGSSEAELRRIAAEEGMRTLRQNGLKKVLDGKTTLEEVMREISL